MNDWIRRNTAGKDRVGELVELYKELGFEVKVEAFSPGSEIPCEQCDECFKSDAGEYFVIYTKSPD